MRVASGSYITAMNTCICIGVTGSVSVTEAVSISSSQANPVWVTGVSGLSSGPVPRGSYQAIVHGLFTPTSAGGATVAGIHNPTTGSLVVRSAVIDITHMADSNAGGAGFAFGGRLFGPSVSGTIVPGAGLHASDPTHLAHVYLNPTDMIVIPMGGGIFPASYPNLAAFSTSQAALGGLRSSIDLLRGAELFLGPSGSYAQSISFTEFVDGAPEMAFTVCLTWDELS